VPSASLVEPHRDGDVDASLAGSRTSARRAWSLRSDHRVLDARVEDLVDGEILEGGRGSQAGELPLFLEG
jgi:hypothetical protein